MDPKDTFNGVYGSGFDDDEEKNPLSVLEAKRVHNGKITVLGTIVSVSEMYIMLIEESNNNGKPEHRDAKSIQLEDSEKLDQIERLDVILYDDDIGNVTAGEVVKITGNMRIEDKKRNARSKKKINVLHATGIKYINRKDVVVTDNDIEHFYKFAKIPNLITRLTSMFAPNVIGHDDVKLGLLRSIVGGVDRGKKGGGRIDTLEVGDPGTAKSTLAQEVTEIKPNSRFVSAPHASTKTLTAIVDKENDGIVLNLGAIPLSKGGICAINEITSFPLEDQSRLLDVLSEGKLPIDKHGRHYEIPSPTTIIATANPIQATWNNSQTISNDEIELRKNLLDRFTQIYGFRDNITAEQTKDFVKQMNKIRQRRPHNYNFLRKYLMVASNIKDVKVTHEAEYMLNTFWVNAKDKGLLNIRMYYGLFKIAEAQAKFQLMEEIDEEIAKQTIESVQVMMAQYGPTVGMVTGLREVTYMTFLDILQKTKSGITVEELCKKACEQNHEIAEYLGNRWSVEHNHRLRHIIDMLLNHSNVRRIGQKPIVLKWISDLSDYTDLTDINNNISSSQQQDQPDHSNK